MCHAGDAAQRHALQVVAGAQQLGCTTQHAAAACAIEGLPDKGSVLRLP